MAENKEQSFDKKKAINDLATTLNKSIADYDELFKKTQDPEYQLKKPRYEYQELNDELVAEAERLLSDTSDFEELRESYNRLIILCFSFNTEIIKIVSGREFLIKPAAGRFLTQICQKNYPPEIGTILYITLNGSYIGNTSLQFLNECADFLVKNGVSRLIYPRLKSYLKQGGMTQPGIEGIIPFREDKRRQIEEICHKLEPQPVRTFEEMTEEDLTI